MSGTTTLIGFMRSRNATRRLSSSIKLNGVVTSAFRNKQPPHRPWRRFVVGRSFLEGTSRRIGDELAF
jgi:hypothetical protein